MTDLSKFNGPIPNPELRDVFDKLKSDIMRSMNCVLPGTIQAFDPIKNTASVSINFKRKLPLQTTEVDYPLLTDCPVFIYAGGYSHIVMPIEPGDGCIILFSDRDIDNWWCDGEATVPNTSRTHSLSDGIVLVGIRAYKDAHNVTENVLEITSNKPIEITALNADHATFSRGASLNKFKLTSTETIIEGATGKIQIKNAVQSLYTILSTATVGGVPFDGPTLTALAALLEA